MRTYLRAGVHFCLIDEGAIFLDLSANAYIGIDAATKRALTGCLAGLEGEPAGGNSGRDLEPPNIVTALLARGLLTESESLGRAFSPLVIPMTHAVPFGTRRPEIRVRAPQVARFLTALGRASMLIRRGRLLELATRLVTLKARLPHTSRSTDLDGAVALVHIARRLAALCYTTKDACLLDSLVLAEFLIRHGHHPTVIFGVRTKPFLAHAWVQLGPCVLNDSVEHAQTLTPIAAI